ncbi:Uma2 family endonuclease [Salinibacter altiplanensis]|uniref:Uma2 family endonuclease n=1 Tax=Salinibacter altiplanensis TaxID=1803181 RepID=UPI000C9F4747|nr:Uma2 family endonuclease [Salinibacter altiplanensis]
MVTAPRPQGGSSPRAATQPAPPPSIAHRVVNDEPIPREEYLTREQEREERCEYVDGWMISMGAASWPHSTITSNIDRTLGNQLLDTDCRTASRDLKVALPSANKNAFPDLVVVCGGPAFDPDQSTLLLNPQIVVEVLSPSTMDYDRGEKFARYRQMDTLQEYLLVAQDAPHAEHYVRQDDGSWRLTDTDGLDATITLPSVEAELSLSEVYLDVFEEDESSEAE